MAKVQPVTDEKHGVILYLFHCPGCKCDHGLDIKQWRDGGNPQWTFNGDLDKPTFTPSLLCDPANPEWRCHSHIRDGKIEFLADCFHKLAGQTVEIPDYED